MENTRTVHVLSTNRPVDRELALEFASTLGTSVTAMPAEGRVVVVTEGPEEEFVSWAGAHRPVVSIRRDARGGCTVAGHDPQPTLGVRDLRDWRGTALDRAFPSWVWPAEDPEITAALPVELRTGVPEDAGIEDVLVALGLPTVTLPLLENRIDARDQDGAVSAAPEKVLGLVKESLLAKPAGTSVVARMRRWDHERPGLSLLYLGVVGALGVASLWVWQRDPFDLPTPARIGVGILGGGLVIDAVGNAVLLGAVRRRARRP